MWINLEGQGYALTFSKLIPETSLLEMTFFFVWILNTGVWGQGKKIKGRHSPFFSSTPYSHPLPGCEYGFIGLRKFNITVDIHNPYLTLEKRVFVWAWMCVWVGLSSDHQTYHECSLRDRWVLLNKMIGCCSKKWKKKDWICSHKTIILSIQTNPQRKTLKEYI